MFVSAGVAQASRANLLCRQLGAQARLMWLDAEANLMQLSTRAGVAETVRKCKAANINTIIVDVKPLSGLVLYHSKVAPRLTRSGPKHYPPDHDLLRCVLEEGRKAGIPVHAAINVFSEGSQVLGGGPALRHTHWQCVHYELTRTLRTGDGATIPVRVAGEPYADGEICLYGQDMASAEGLPRGTRYVRVDETGMPAGFGTATGRPRISAPDGGFVLIGCGKAGDWLRRAYESGTTLRIEAERRLVPVGSSAAVHNAVFVNPLHAEVRKYEIAVVEEICRNYPVDGLVLDRMRYPNIYADFGELTRRAFERHIGHTVENWPEDIFRIPTIPGDIIRGPLFGRWLTFRAQVMRDYLLEVRSLVKSIRPKAKLGIYVGSWYPLYYDVGVNWGSPNHSPELEWWPEGYQQTGYADLVDYMCTGCYYEHPRRKDALAAGRDEWRSVEAAGEESVNAVKDSTFVYGSIYLLQYKGRPKQFLRAVQACLDTTQGCMLFDLCYVRDYRWWDQIKKGFPAPANAPHDVPGLASRLHGRERDIAGQ